MCEMPPPPPTPVTYVLIKWSSSKQYRSQRRFEVVCECLTPSTHSVNEWFVIKMGIHSTITNIKNRFPQKKPRAEQILKPFPAIWTSPPEREEKKKERTIKKFEVRNKFDVSSCPFCLVRTTRFRFFDFRSAGWNRLVLFDFYFYSSVGPFFYKKEKKTFVSKFAFSLGA